MAVNIVGMMIGAWVPVRSSYLGAASVHSKNEESVDKVCCEDVLQSQDPRRFNTNLKCMRVGKGEKKELIDPSTTSYQSTQHNTRRTDSAPTSYQST